MDKTTENKRTKHNTKHKDNWTKRQRLQQATPSTCMITCKNCPQRYISQTSQKIKTRIIVHKNAIKRHNFISLPAVTLCFVLLFCVVFCPCVLCNMYTYSLSATHIYDNCHTFAWTKTQLLYKHKQNMPANSKKLGLVQTGILLTGILTFLLSTYNLRQSVRILSIIPLTLLILTYAWFSPSK